MTDTQNNEPAAQGGAFQVGELVDVTIRGARVVHTYLTSTVVALSDRPGDEFDLPNRWATFTRVAPAEWPPQPGDVWFDGGGNAWATLGGFEGNGPVRMHPTVKSDGGWVGPEYVATTYGPMRLEYRPGWTRQPDPDPAGPAEPVEPGEVDKRTGVILSLRSMANYIEANPDIPTPYGAAAQCDPGSMEHFRELVDRHSATVHVDDDDKTWARIEFGAASLTIYYRKPQPVVDEPTQPLPIVPAADVDEDDDRCPATSMGGLITKDHACELYGRHVGTDHVCLCGYSWKNDAPGVDVEPIPAPRPAGE